jgi:Coenzyme PQQ synthesis protein D (PqqD)
MKRKLAPKARKENLIVKELADEVLVYDENNHNALCLNHTAALVWKFCDGRSSIPQITRLLEKEMSANVTEPTVWLALKQLDESSLLEASLAQHTWMPQTSRRELVRRIGLAAIALPLISSVKTANAVAVSSCRTVGQPCTGAGLGNCCPGLGLACQGAGPTCQIT